MLRTYPGYKHKTDINPNFSEATLALKQRLGLSGMKSSAMFSLFAHKFHRFFRQKNKFRQ